MKYPCQETTLEVAFSDGRALRIWIDQEHLLHPDFSDDVDLIEKQVWVLIHSTPGSMELIRDVGNILGVNAVQIIEAMEPGKMRRGTMIYTVPF